MSIAEHGAYNGWCRIAGIPTKAGDCPSCLRSLRLTPGAWRMLDEIRLRGNRGLRCNPALLAASLWIPRNGNGSGRARSMLSAMRDKGLVVPDDAGHWRLTEFGVAAVGSSTT